jgi:hypothetical protein
MATAIAKREMEMRKRKKKTVLESSIATVLGVVSMVRSLAGNTHHAD